MHIIQNSLKNLTSETVIKFYPGLYIVGICVRYGQFCSSLHGQLLLLLDNAENAKLDEPCLEFNFAAYKLVLRQHNVTHKKAA